MGSNPPSAAAAALPVDTRVTTALEWLGLFQPPLAKKGASWPAPRKAHEGPPKAMASRPPPLCSK